MSGFRTSESHVPERPVPIVRIDQNQFGIGSKPVSAIRRPVEWNWNWTSDSRRLELEWTGRPITGRFRPDFRRYSKSGRFNNRRVFENAEIRMSGFRTFTVCCSKNNRETSTVFYLTVNKVKALSICYLILSPCNLSPSCEP